MTFIDLLSGDKEEILLKLGEAKSPDAVSGYLEKVLDKYLYRFQEGEESPYVLGTAAHLIETAKASLLFADSDGEPVIWEKPADSDRPAKKSGHGRPALAVLLLLAAVALMSAAAVLLVTRYPAIAEIDQWELILGLALGGVVLAALGGFFIKKKPREARETIKKADVPLDPAKIYRALQTVILTIDKQISLAREEEKSAEAKRKAASGGPLSVEETELMAALLEALYSGDSEFALDRLEDVRYYLHKKEIEIVDYSKDKESWFEIMPSEKEGTIRPALANDGRLIKKGLAAGGI